MSNEFHSGFVTIVGRPNVGKSTLLNQLIGEKVSIISDKIQTTRNIIQGIYTDEVAQIIFIDTPEIHKPKHRLDEYMVDVYMQTLRDVDVILFMTNVTEGYGRGDQFIIDQLKTVNKPVYLLLNKVDLIHPDVVFSLIEQYKDLYEFNEIIPISAQHGNNVQTLLDLLKVYLPKGPKYYSDKQLTNRSEWFM